MECAIGAALAAAVCVFGRVAGFDRERVFYPTVLIVVASYYILFGAMGNSLRSVVVESAVAGAFLLLAVAAFRKSLWLAAGGLAGHGVFDFFHGGLIANPGVPVWWPGFCLSFDVIAGVLLAVLLSVRFSKAVRQPL